MMYEFIKNMYHMGRLSAEKVQSFVGRYITQEQAEEITAE
jgi:uncharacterized XkdX family phage protein